MRISDWSSDVCSSDLDIVAVTEVGVIHVDRLAQCGCRLVEGHARADGADPVGACHPGEGVDGLGGEWQRVCGRGPVRDRKSVVAGKSVRKGRTRWSPYYTKKKIPPR